MKRIKEKLSSSRGFTLAETLMCVLILLMVTGIVAAAIPTASNVYTGAVDAANAQVLESTAITVLRDELSTANVVLCTNSGDNPAVIMYRTAETGRWNRIVSKYSETPSKPEDNSIIIFEYSKDTAGETFDDVSDGESISYEVEGRALVSDKAVTSNLSISFEEVSYNETTGIITIKKLRVYRKGSANPVAERDELTIKTIA